MTPIYKILPRAEWERALAVGRFEGSVVDLADGFIHFSGADQWAETARRHFSGQDDLMLLTVDAAYTMDHWDEKALPGFLAGTFAHERPWNEPGDGSPDAEDRYSDPALIRGSLNLSHQGCGYMVRLVLNGPQRGTLWEDGRCSDMGITPFLPDFATWYRQWFRDPEPR